MRANQRRLNTTHSRLTKIRLLLPSMRQGTPLNKMQTSCKRHQNEKKLGDMVARLAKDVEWNTGGPRPFDNAHQLSESLHPWADQTKYFCGDDLTKRLSDITTSL